MINNSQNLNESDSSRIFLTIDGFDEHSMHSQAPHQRKREKHQISLGPTQFVKAVQRLSHR